MLSLATLGQNGVRRVVTVTRGRFMRDIRCLFTFLPEYHIVPKTRNRGPSSFYSSGGHHRCFNASAAHCNSSSSQHQKTPTYSYIVVGAGSAGCVLANRLTEDANESLLLLEAGPKDMLLGSVRLSWKIHMPAALTYNLCDDKYSSSVISPVFH